MDWQLTRIEALDDEDGRAFEVAVAGPTAPLEPGDTITASCAVLTQDLLQAVIP